MSKSVQRTLRRFYRSPECDLSRGEKVILMTLAYFGGDDGMGCQPGVKKLARYTDYSERQITRILHKLEAKALIATTSRIGGRGHPTNYTIIYGKQEAAAPELPEISEDAFAEELPEEAFGEEPTGVETFSAESPFALPGWAMSNDPQLELRRLYRELDQRTQILQSARGRRDSPSTELYQGLLRETQKKIAELEAQLASSGERQAQ